VKGEVIASNTTVEKSYRLAIGILAWAAGVALLYYGRVLIVTVLIATIISVLLDPLVELFMRLRLPRGLASFVVCSISLMFLYLAGLGIYTESLMMADDLPAYGARINQLVDGAVARMDQFETRVYRTLIPRRFQDNPPNAQQPPDPNPPAPAARGKRKQAAPEPPQTPSIQEVRVRPEPTPLVLYVYDYLRSFYDVLLMASFVPFLVYFLLAWRDHMRSRLLTTLEGEP
jgi:predicted PurR-regulated permease PerM